MKEIVDARGLSCPEPVMLTLSTIKKFEKGEINILVDTETSKENVIRAVTSMGWQVLEVEKKEGNYRLLIKRE
ncbi:MAG: sulfurtransferase TusA family protein [Thermodesulfobacteriaceae bacterium]|nr:sulfurtransferase TusA family protein [Thermodesulfobacteriaceae bacterium]